MIRLSVATLTVALLATAAIGQTTKPTPAPATGSAATTAPATPAAPTMSTTSKPATTHAATSSASSTQFPDEAAAKSHCPTDTVVWVNLSSKVYHMAGTSSYGKTKKGAYICQMDADHSGFHVAKGEVPKKATPASTTKP